MLSYLISLYRNQKLPADLLASIFLAQISAPLILILELSLELSPVYAQASGHTNSSINLEKARALNMEGIKLQSEGKLNDAALRYRKAITLWPKGGAYHNNLAVVLKELKELEEAEKEARIALALKPERFDYHFNLGLILQLSRKYEEAEKEFRKVLSFNASDVECRYRLSQVLALKSSFEEAESQMRMALLLKPEEKRYHQLLADILMQTGKKEEALYEYKKVIEMSVPNPPGPEVMQRVRYLQEVLGTR